MQLLQTLSIVSILLLPGADEDKVRAFQGAWRAAGDDAAAQAEAILLLKGEDTEEVARILIKILGAREIPISLEDAILEVMGGLRSEAAVRHVAKQVHSHGRWQARVIIARGLRESRHPAALDGLHKALAHRRWAVRSAVVAAIRAIRKKESVEPLIGRLEKEDGRVAGEIHRALRHITGLDLAHLEEWQIWWEGSKENFEVPPLERARPPTEPGNTVTKSIYGEVISKKVIFVVDVSESMKVVLTKGPDRGLSRLQIMKRELCRAVLFALPEKAEFNIIAYGTEVIPWKRKLIESTQKNRDQACAWVDRLELSGDTNIMGALDAALDMGGKEIHLSRGKGGNQAIPLEEFLRTSLPQEHRSEIPRLIREGRVSVSGQIAAPERQVSPGEKVVVRLLASEAAAARGPDTVYLLSDGSPSVGRLTVTYDILREVHQMNGTRNVAIHTFALLGGDGKKYNLIESKSLARDFLKKLASQNGGTCKAFE